ncbi:MULTISPECIES: hypothetical protein [Paraburkholderia]|uniref:Uncharacterized protein n=1 Tax=Paraburkholderia podalyriae TaxID=1938811 RepID=A0ABR7Q0N3_9BURK|nr:hypothetical protein [Paraburkholderia podalyriae]MBC8752090.1 hypothetical protein [Paraburkholderia podalyriae]
MSNPDEREVVPPPTNIVALYSHQGGEDATSPSVAHALETLSEAVLDGAESVASIALDMVRAATGATKVVLIRRGSDCWMPQTVVSASTTKLLEVATPELLREDNRILCGAYELVRTSPIAGSTPSGAIMARATTFREGGRVLSR